LRAIVRALVPSLTQRYPTRTFDQDVSYDVKRWPEGLLRAVTKLNGCDFRDTEDETILMGWVAGLPVAEAMVFVIEARRRVAAALGIQLHGDPLPLFGGELDADLARLLAQSTHA
jgi:hypothetical protein